MRATQSSNQAEIQPNPAEIKPNLTEIKSNGNQNGNQNQNQIKADIKSKSNQLEILIKSMEILGNRERIKEILEKS